MTRRTYDCTADRNENFAHDNITDALTGLSEVYHETKRKDVDGYGEIEKPFEVPGSSDGVANNEKKNSGHDLEGAVDHASLRNRDSKYNLKKRLEVEVPAIIGHLIREIDEAGGDDGAVEEVTLLHERGRGEIDLLDDE